MLFCLFLFSIMLYTAAGDSRNSTNKRSSFYVFETLYVFLVALLEAARVVAVHPLAPAQCSIRLFFDLLAV